MFTSFESTLLGVLTSGQTGTIIIILAIHYGPTLARKLKGMNGNASMRGAIDKIADKQDKIFDLINASVMDRAVIHSEIAGVKRTCLLMHGQTKNNVEPTA